MASKDNKTSKTARVMNLLSKKQDPTPAEETTEAAASASSAPVPPILNSMSPDAEVSVQIKNALEDALEEEMSPQPHPAEDDDFFVGQPQPERGNILLVPVRQHITQFRTRTKTYRKHADRLRVECPCMPYFLLFTDAAELRHHVVRRKTRFLINVHNPVVHISFGLSKPPSLTGLQSPATGC